MSVSVERQLELARKYSVPEDVISAIQNGSEEERSKAAGELTTTLVNAIFDSKVELDDIEDVSAMVPSQFAVSKADYKMLLTLSRLLG